MDEVFGSENFVSQITLQDGSLGADDERPGSQSDYLFWYAKTSRDQVPAALLGAKAARTGIYEYHAWRRWAGIRRNRHGLRSGWRL